MFGPLTHHLLERSADHRPEALLCVSADGAATHGDVEMGANRTARVRLALGVAPRDRVGLLAENSRAYIEGYFGILKTGALVVPLQVAADAASHARLLYDCGATGLVFSARQARALAGLPVPPGLRFLLGP